MRPFAAAFPPAASLQPSPSPCYCVGGTDPAQAGVEWLIRIRSDCGLVCIMDSRLITKDYGAEFV